ncbi:MAG: hypothetical protein ABSB22_16585 [Thermodesulfobacteriota bacterium]
MADADQKLIYKNGVRFESTPYGLFCCPEENKNRKHDCPDCKLCQWCSGSRCSLCLHQGQYDPFDHQREESKKNSLHDHKFLLTPGSEARLTIPKKA